MIALVNPQTTRFPRVHAAVKNKPLCGGGNRKNGDVWQTDLGEVNCKACLALMAERVKRNERIERKAIHLFKLVHGGVGEEAQHAFRASGGDWHRLAEKVLKLEQKAAMAAEVKS